MDLLKVGFVVAAGLGSTWAAREATDAFFVQSQGHQLVQAAGKTPAPAEAAKAPPSGPSPDQEQIDAELKRAQDEIAGRGKDDELKEFRPTKPLSADLAVALPSDI